MINKKKLHEALKYFDFRFNVAKAVPNLDENTEYSLVVLEAARAWLENNETHRYRSINDRLFSAWSLGCKIWRRSCRAARQSS